RLGRRHQDPERASRAGGGARLGAGRHPPAPCDAGGRFPEVDRKEDSRVTGYLKMTRAGLRSFLRDKSGVFWSFFFPLFFIVIFGSIFGSAGDRAKAMKFKV